MATRSALGDEDLSEAAKAVFDDIRSVRQTDYVNNFWRVLANDPDELHDVWERLKQVMGPGVLDPLTKELIYMAVSTANGCSYCVHSHTAAAKAKGMSEAQHSEALAVIAMAARTNALATALQVPTDGIFLES